MATSLFFIPTVDQNSVGNPNELLRNSHRLVNVSGEIRTEPQKTRGRKPGSKKGQQNQKKERLRGMGVAQLERHRIEQEKKMIAGDGDGDMTSSVTSSVNPKTTRLPVPDPVVVLQGFPSSYGGGPTRSRFICGGVGSGQIVIDPVCSPWGFVETSTHHELSSIPNNPQIYNNNINRCDTCFKKKRLDGDHNNVVRSNGGGGFSKYTMIPMNGYDQRSHSFCYDHNRISRSASFNPYFNEPTGSMEEFGSYMEGNPRNGSGGVKEYEFFPGKYDDFPGKYGKTVSVATSIGDCSPTNTSTIDLSLKL